MAAPTIALFLALDSEGDVLVEVGEQVLRLRHGFVLPDESTGGPELAAGASRAGLVRECT